MYQELLGKAQEAKERAYAPYSGFRVGAAVLGEDNRVYTGCNIENVSFGATCCAERVAIFKALSEGEKDLKAIAIVSDAQRPIFPCGICRQVMAEFNIQRIIIDNPGGDYREYTLGELMPYAFDSFDDPGE